MRRSRAPRRCDRGCLQLAALPLASARKSRSNERRSGYEDMSRDNKAMQDDDTANPGMLAVLDGEALWSDQGRRLGQILRRLPWRRQAPA